MSKLKKVLIVLNDTGRGGAETQALYLAKGLIANGYTIAVLSFGSKKGPYWDDFESLGIEMNLTHFNSKLLVQTTTFSSKINAIWFALKFIRLLRKINADVIIPFTYFPNVTAGMYWRFTKAKICFWNQRDGGIMFNGTTKEVSALENATIIVSNSLEGSLFLEKYTNNVKYESKKEMDEKFYKPLFTKTYNGLQIGGHYIINICKEVYDNVLKELLGEAHEIFPLKKSKRQNDYTEMVYVWKK